MFFVLRGDLQLSHPVVMNEINRLLDEEIKDPQLSLEWLRYFLYFYNNIEKIINPVTVFLENGSIRNVNPGRNRLISCFYKQKSSIDSIIVGVRGRPSLSYIKQFTDNVREEDDPIFVKYGSDEKDHARWSVSTADAKLFEQKAVLDYYTFQQEGTIHFGNFLKKIKNYRWVTLSGEVLFEGADPKYTVIVNTRRNLCDSIIAILNDTPMDPSVPLEEIND